MATGHHRHAVDHGDRHAGRSGFPQRTITGLKTNPAKSGRPSRTAGLLLSAIALTWTGSVLAQTAATETSPQVWLNAGSYSHHFDREKNFRENNTGFGAEIWLKENHGLMGGTFINSDGVRSHYAAYQWRPLHWQPAGIHIAAGITLGAFDGYPRYREGGWFPAALPVLSVEYKMVGVNLLFVPTIPDRLDGALAIQFKLRVW